ncbi:penicillin acylase family protein [Denitrobaculum tricleocarpae]|uniref:Penicillin acylase family protein n=1 Tax=Denitrobaculum tricleocarpae TaxID=2591009 RepID=A0A545TTK7_9PROT|nr:penicillin acylase family protein [Denitrobaculum tricleocarpae]TQV80556.1 penicillin acylase family protein [Denitrobaculum tricleocarpae]
MRRVLRYGFWGVTSLLALLLVVAVGGFLWLRTSLPDLNSDVLLPGLQAEVTALRDKDGIVTIKAGSDLDAYRALGYLHAQDRLWQMDLMRRSAAGRLSEVIGSPTIRMDRIMRTLGLYNLAKASYSKLTPEVRSALDAYTAGVNAYMDSRSGALPPEFHLLRYSPEPWSPADSLVWSRLMAIQLSGNWRSELLRARLNEFLKPEQIRALWPDYPADAPVALAGLDRRAALDPLESLPWALEPKDASNSWVLSGAKTTTGKPILANDPHLALNAPGLWYLVDIRTPDGRIRGASAPGVPFVVLGQNQHLAWGFTTTHSDTQDLFVEKLDPAQAGHYITPEGPRPFETREEVIAVRGAEDVVLNVRRSRNGPIIDDIADPEDLASASKTAGAESGTRLALAWPALRDDDLIPQAIYGFNKASNWQEFLAASRFFHAPQQNIVYADVNGNIGLVVPGRVPIRAKGDGRVPVPGWSDEYAWTGFIPFEEMPQGANPEAGLYVVANNKIVDDDYPHLITADWPSQYRAARIQEVLDATPKGSIEDSLALQNDIVSIPARTLMPFLLQTEASSPAAKEALALLSNWDFRLDRTRPEGLIYNNWLNKLNAALLEDELRAEFSSFRRPKTELVARILSGAAAASDPPLDWCDDIGTGQVESCAQILASSLEDSLAEIAAAYGDDIDAWRWGDVHRATLPHPILSRIPVLSDLFDISVETDGGAETVKRAGVSFNGPLDKRFNDRHGAGYRAVYDLADPANSRFMIATGQSANPLSQHYGSFAERWRDSQYVTIDTSEANAKYRMLLKPE